MKEVKDGFQALRNFPRQHLEESVSYDHLDLFEILKTK